MAPYDALTEFLWRAGVFCLVLVWVLWTARRTLDLLLDLYQNWDRWETVPFPDENAVKNVAVLLGHTGVNLLLLWFALWWFAGA